VIQTALIVCDASLQVGHGHLVRCLGLAQSLAELEVTVKFCGRFDARAQSLLKDFAISVARSQRGSPAAARETVAMADAFNAELVVIDSYAIDADFIRRLLKPNRRVVLIDDFSGWPEYPATHVLNFAIDAALDHYPAGPAYLLGPSLFPVRRAFRAARRVSLDEKGRAHRISIVMSSDPAGERTLLVLAALADVAPTAHVRAVLSHPPGEKAALVDASLAAFGNESTWEHGLADLAEQLAWSDVAICSAGLVKYEAGYMGVPALVISLPGREARDTAAWAARGAAIDLGDTSKLDHVSLRAGLGAALSRADLAVIGKTAQSFFPEDCAVRAARAIS
jgi:UDP-2,4-diacetamido-2,4,6-trideoxy-beta-L-altropyranose hydrolase